MGIGGIDFRVRGLVGAVCVVLASGCRTSAEADGLRAAVHVAQSASAASAGEPSAVAQHRFGRWLALEPDAVAVVVLERAAELDRGGLDEEAIALLGEALDEGPACASLLEARGALYVAAGFPRAAAGDFQRAVALAPERGSGWFALGHAYEVLGLSRQALEALERARGLGVDDADVHLSLARVNRALGWHGRSARHYELALARLAPEEATPVALLAEATTLATEDAARFAAVEAQRERLESCRGEALSDDGWLLRALLDEMPGAPATEIAATFHALDAPPVELHHLTGNLLTACQLVDPATTNETRARLLSTEPDATRRAALERCLVR
jgi:tetratricopeptide (TPR) repeat protein